MSKNYKKLVFCVWMILCIIFSACAQPNNVDVELYQPNSLTISFYDTSENLYGFTWNTKAEPINPVLQIQEGEKLSQRHCREYEPTVSVATTYEDIEGIVEYYILKVEIVLEPLKIYSYRVYDKNAKVGSSIATLETKDLQSETFSFAHVSDSQTVEENSFIDLGGTFGKTLSQIVEKNDFIVHTGDVVHTAYYERNWTAMLGDNFAYLSKIPMMAISGNHETIYHSPNNNETFKHFNNKIPEQTSTSSGYYYSFNYGNAKFIMLNTFAGRVGLELEQYNWLISELKNNTATWTIVAMHCPMYSVGKWGADPTRNTLSLDLRSQLQGVFNEYGVDIVLQGHDHTISRTYPIDDSGNPNKDIWIEENGIEYSVDPNGVIYLMNGPAGSQARAPYEIDSTLYDYAEESKSSSWADISINGNKLKVSVKYFDGEKSQTYYEWGIKKSENFME